MSAKLAAGFFEVSENVMLQALNVSPPPRAPVVEIMVLWKTPTISWLKVNTDGFVNLHSAASGGIFRDYMANFRGVYAQTIGNQTVLHAELMAIILAMEIANKKG
ncbi:RNA-directed DNA polymerase (Reverse transcriptase) [Trifolium medium]|uniref:RNA-directed DNA polymerase (Reverse transcriptase) n=1 Tax=Trifolium medium TaxID=97028 RepID=A0A392Q5Y1_9FABA|nr:RNA-directed DNA polymerase (Reverse transcriptase) [Trifolium medium]